MDGADATRLHTGLALSEGPQSLCPPILMRIRRDHQVLQNLSDMLPTLTSEHSLRLLLWGFWKAADVAAPVRRRKNNAREHCMFVQEYRSLKLFFPVPTLSLPDCFHDEPHRTTPRYMVRALKP